MWYDYVMLPSMYGGNPAVSLTNGSLNMAATNIQSSIGMQSTTVGPNMETSINSAGGSINKNSQSASVMSLLGSVNGSQFTNGLQELKFKACALKTPPGYDNEDIDTSNHYHIFVGDLAPEIDGNHLREKFSDFGKVTECKIIKDMHTQKPKGYGFVAYGTKEEAEDALNNMNGRLLGSRMIRTNWAVRKPASALAMKNQKPLDYEEVYVASSLSNCTVYVGGITNGLSEELLKSAFKGFGEILEIRLFKEKGYAFVRFDTHEGATRAIITMHGKDVGYQPCKCSWGKECNDMKESSQIGQNPILNQYTSLIGNQLGYPYALLSPQLANLALPQTASYTNALSALQGGTNTDILTPSQAAYILNSTLGGNNMSLTSNLLASGAVGGISAQHLAQTALMNNLPNQKNAIHTFNSTDDQFMGQSNLSADRNSLYQLGAANSYLNTALLSANILNSNGLNS